MAWSLGYLPVREPERLNAFFLSVGKSLYLANSFETKCRYLLQLTRFINALQDGNDFDAANAILCAMKDKMLAATLSELRGSQPVGPEDFATLEGAKDARNFIAHEGASLGQIWLVTGSRLDSHTAQLRDAVSALALGDNLVSQWIYEIEEKERAPFTIHNEYPRWVDRWVFGDQETEIEQEAIR